MSNWIDYLKGKSFAKQDLSKVEKRSIVKSLAFTALKSIHFRKPNEKQVFIHSSFRSGSTWLAEMLSSLDYSRLINEPFSPYKYQLGRFISPITPSQIYFSQSSDELMRFLRLLVDGKTHLSHRYDVLSKNHSFISSLAVFKFLRVTPLINDFVKNFEGAHIALIRHPIATALSKVKSGIRVEGRVEDFLSNESYVNQYLTNEEVQLAKDIVSNGSELESSILEWCLDNKPLVMFKKNTQNTNLIFISYEQLVESPTEHVLSILEMIGKVDAGNRVHSATNKVSAAAGSYSSDKVKSKLVQGRAKDLLYSFSSFLDESTVSRCLSIVDSFDMSIYSQFNFAPTDFFSPLKCDNEYLN